MLSITTDYQTSLQNPEPYLCRIAEAGFTHLHWCHQWNTDFLYGPAELKQLLGWLKNFHLAINDIHGSAGQEKSWGSPVEYQRQAGLELIRNRLEMAHQAGCDVVIMHFPTEPAVPLQQREYWDRMRRNLDQLAADCRRSSVRIALENMSRDDGPTLAKVFDLYPAEFIGFCYDPGHGNIAGNGLDRLDQFKHRLLATHLNDNDGKSDQHRLIFTGTIDWSRLARLIAESSYNKPVMSMEVVMRNSGIEDESTFLAEAARSGEQFAQMVHGARLATQAQDQAR